MSDILYCLTKYYIARLSIMIIYVYIERKVVETSLVEASIVNGSTLQVWMVELGMAALH